MNQYAHLTILRGFCTCLRLPEIRFHYPPAEGNEKDLYIRAINNIKQNSELIRYYWTLMSDIDYEPFLNHLKTIPGHFPDIVIIPDNIAHGDIQFSKVIRFDGYSHEDKELLTQLIIDGGIPPWKNAMDWWIVSRRKEMAACGRDIDEEEWNAEVRSTFARHLDFYSEE